MLARYVIKVAGSAGQGIKSSGVTIAKALKRAGYFGFGYSEYPSLIRGGHNIFQIEIADREIASVTKKLDLLLALNQESIKLHGPELTQDGALIYDDGAFSLTPEEVDGFMKRGVEVYPIELLKLAKDNGGSAIMKNTVSLGAVWKTFNLDLNILLDTIAQVFNKSEEIVKINKACATAGYNALQTKNDYFSKNFKPDTQFADNMLISGNEAIGLGAISAGVRMYSTYPMTPSSAILSYLAEEGPKYGMIVKQAEDEIMAANMVMGAYFAGTRAMCGTSGGGFDLMTESLSLSGITETPFVAVLGQRPGPATGAPTWTAQGDLDLAVNGGHGEFPRIVIAVSDAEDAFQGTKEAHNLAEIYQLPVIIMTDKLVAEGMYNHKQFDQNKVKVNRGKLIQGDDLKNYQGNLRYQYTEDGVSPRWVPGDQANTFVGNSDEHDERGYSTEEADEIENMMKKRLQKITTIKNSLPEPMVFGDQQNPDLLVLSWGSNKGPIIDAIAEINAEKPDFKMTLVHYRYMWPLKVEMALALMKKSKKVCSIEANYFGQLSRMFRQETGFEITEKFNKFDGRPFYLEELVAYLEKFSS
jgi:2-oxoglutarate ferredoxin oxidoreductase subunit alpha